MARIEKYSSILRKGAGYFVRQLKQDDYIIVSNGKNSDSSFVMMRANDFAKLNGMAGYIGEKDAVENALKDIKIKNSETYRKVRSLRKS